MTKKVLVWLDDNYTYLHYGICSELSKLDDFEFFGFVSNQKNLDLFSAQNKVKFTELHYFPQYYNNKPKTPDFDFLRSLETKIGMNIWQLAYSERSFLEERNFFHKFNINEILQIIESISKFYIEFLERVKPDFIIIQPIGESITNILLYLIAKNLNISSPMLMPLKLSNSRFLTDDYSLSELKSEFNKIKKSSPKKLEKFDQNYLKKRTQLKHVETVLKYPYGKSNFSEKISRYSKRIFSTPEPLFFNRGKTPLRMLKYRFKIHFQQKSTSKFIEKISLKSIPNKKFVYYPLSVFPEANVLFYSPYFVNQLSIIQNIAKSLPSDYILCIKEHPAQETKLWRNINFYKSLSTMPNVELIHHSNKNFDLIPKSSLVITVNNTSGFEALFFKKPVIVLGDIFYDEIQGVIKISSFSDLPNAIKKSLENSSILDFHELSYLVSAIENKELVIPYSNFISDSISLTSKINHSSSPKKLLPGLMNFLTKYQNEFRKIAISYNEYNTKN